MYKRSIHGVSVPDVTVAGSYRNMTIYTLHIKL